MSAVRVERAYVADWDVRTSARLITGRAVPYGVAELVSDDGVGEYREEFAPRSFARSTMPANAGRTSLNYTHLETRLNRLGRPVWLEERRDGLWGEWKVDETPVGDMALELARDGQLSGMSVAAIIRASEQRGDVTVRRDASLVHVALVEEPAYSGALVEAVREAVRPSGESAAVWASRLQAMRQRRSDALR